MRLALLSRTFLRAQPGGMERHTTWLADMLAAQGHQVTIVCASQTGSATVQRADTPVDVISVNAPGDRWSREWRRLTEQVVGRVQPDLVIAQSTSGGHLTNRWPVVTHLHGNHVNELVGAWATWGRSRTRTAVRRTVELAVDYARWKPWEIAGGQVIALSLREARLARLLYRVDPADITVVGNPVSPLFAQRPPRDSHRIVFTGRLEPSKGADLLLEAFLASELARSGYELHIAGDGPQRELLKDRLRHSSHASQVHLRGILEPIDLARLVTSSEIACFPSRRRESFSISVLEAMASGCAILASRQAGMSDIQTHPMASGQTSTAGITVTPNQRDAWRDALDMLGRDWERREQLKDSAASVSESFAAKRVTVSLLEAYQRAAKGFGRSSTPPLI